jgi:predicted transcriptional regulator
MAKRPTAEMITEGLSVPERIMLFCIASATDWQKAAGLTHTVARRLMIRGLIDRQAADTYVLTDQGRAVLEALMMRAATRG